MAQEIGNNVVFDEGFIFHKSFVNTYKRGNIIQTRRKLKEHYHKHMQDVIIRYLKEKGHIYNI